MRTTTARTTLTYADPETRTIEALALRGGAYELAARLEASARGGLPPFQGLIVDVGGVLG